MDAVEQMKTQHSKDADICHSLNMAQQVVIARCVDLVNSLIFKQEKLDKIKVRLEKLKQEGNLTEEHYKECMEIFHEPPAPL